MTTNPSLGYNIVSKPLSMLNQWERQNLLASVERAVVVQAIIILSYQESVVCKVITVIMTVVPWLYYRYHIWYMLRCTWLWHLQSYWIGYDIQRIQSSNQAKNQTLQSDSLWCLHNVIRWSPSCLWCYLQYAWTSPLAEIPWFSNFWDV